MLFDKILKSVILSIHFYLKSVYFGVYRYLKSVCYLFAITLRKPHENSLKMAILPYICP